MRPYFQGGQMPLVRRIPKRGFSRARFKIRRVAVRLDRLEQFAKAGETIDLETMRKWGFVKGTVDEVKVVGKELSKTLSIRAHRFSLPALEAIQKAGGKAEFLGSWRPPQPKDETQEKKAPAKTAPAQEKAGKPQGKSEKPQGKAEKIQGKPDKPKSEKPPQSS